MKYTHSTSVFKATDHFAVDWAPAVAQASAASGDDSQRDGAFIAMLNAYRAHGGLSRLHNLTQHGYGVCDGQRYEVEDLLLAGELFGFRWCHATWIPMFQFALHGPTLSYGPQRVVAELGGIFDGWALATWFVAPNAFLANHAPIECLNAHLPHVLKAARTDRFVAVGQASVQAIHLPSKP